MITPPDVRKQNSEPFQGNVWEISQTSGKRIKRLWPVMSRRTAGETRKQTSSPSLPAAFGMKVAGAALVGPSPSRPSQRSRHGTRLRPDQTSQQVVNFWDCEREQRQHSLRSIRQDDRECMGFFLGNNGR